MKATTRNHGDYIIIRERNILELELLVRRFMFDGWQPSGPVVPDGKRYMQSMIKQDT